MAALITLLMPGAGPPPTRMPSFSLGTSTSPSPLLVYGLNRGRNLAQAASRGVSKPAARIGCRFSEGRAPCAGSGLGSQGAQLALDLIAHTRRALDGKLPRSKIAGAVAARVNPRPMTASRRTSASLVVEEQRQLFRRARPGHPAQRHRGPANDQAIRGVRRLGLGLDQLAQEDLDPRRGHQAQRGHRARAKQSIERACPSRDGHEGDRRAPASARSSTATATSWVAR